MNKTKEKIIRACEELAIKRGRGFYNISMEELAEAAGISKRTIYRHFAGKEEIIEATIEVLAEEVTAKNAELLASRKDVKEITVRIFKNIAYFVNQQTLKELQQYYPLLWNKIEKIRQSKIDLLMAALMNNPNVKLRWRVKPEIFKAAFTAAMTAVLNPQFILESGMSFEEVGNNFLEMFMFGAVERVE